MIKEEILLKTNEDNRQSLPNFVSVGQILKHYRELANLSIEEIEEKTLIKNKFLYLLEENLTEGMPSLIYVYSYIKQYAQLLGLDGNELIKLYQKQFNTDDLQFSTQSDKIDNTYLENKTIIETNKKNIGNDGRVLMDFDKVFDNMAGDELNKSADDTEQNVNMPKPAENRTPIEPPVLENTVPQNGDANNKISQELLYAANQAQTMVNNAHKEAERIISEAQEYYRAAKQEATQLKYEAIMYADDLLKSLERDFEGIVSEVRNGREFIRNQKIQNSMNSSSFEV